MAKAVRECPRMKREVHVRICGRLGAEFPGPTRQSGNRVKSNRIEAVKRKLSQQPGKRHCACSRLYLTDLSRVTDPQRKPCCCDTARVPAPQPLVCHSLP